MNFKIAFLFGVFAVSSFFLIDFKHNEVVQFEAQAIVTAIDWESWGHRMPIITIEHAGRTVLFKHSRITLNPDALKVGDSFKKFESSKFCEINGVTTKCID